jgi:hypothetical protein
MDQDQVTANRCDLSTIPDKSTALKPIHPQVLSNAIYVSSNTRQVLGRRPRHRPSQLSLHNCKQISGHFLINGLYLSITLARPLAQSQFKLSLPQSHSFHRLPMHIRTHGGHVRGTRSTSFPLRGGRSAFRISSAARYDYLPHSGYPVTRILFPGSTQLVVSSRITLCG